jgi:hypothetical protein
MSSQPEAQMSTRRHVDETRTGVGRQTETKSRLSIGPAAVFIAALSVLSWAVLIAIVIGLQAVL